MLLTAEDKGQLLELYLRNLKELKTLQTFRKLNPRQQRQIKQMQLLKENLDIILDINFNPTGEVTIP